MPQAERPGTIDRLAQKTAWQAGCVDSLFPIAWRHQLHLEAFLANLSNFLRLCCDIGIRDVIRGFAAGWEPCTLWQDCPAGQVGLASFTELFVWPCLALGLQAFEPLLDPPSSDFQHV